MSGEINVISRTQQIIVEPISKSVSVINAGPPGPNTGIPGPPGVVQSIVAGPGIVVDSSAPASPIVSAPSIVPTAWTAVTFQNNWRNRSAPQQPVKYRKLGNVVQIIGSLEGGTPGTVAFALPVGFRPAAYDQHFPVVGWMPDANSLGGTELVVTAASGACSINGVQNVFVHLGLITVILDG